MSCTTRSALYAQIPVAMARASTARGRYAAVPRAGRLRLCCARANACSAHPASTYLSPSSVKVARGRDAAHSRLAALRISPRLPSELVPAEARLAGCYTSDSCRQHSGCAGCSQAPRFLF
eukprot:2451594-Prymnesium_polylepis.1